MQTAPAGVAATIARAMAVESGKEADFLMAWRDAVDMIGAQYFLLKTPTDQCMSKWDMQPKIDLLRARVGVMSSGEQVFVKTVIQFYNEDIFKAHDRPTLRDIAGRLDAERLNIVLRLLRSYSGW